MGRYLDTLADLLVNAALFAAIGYVTGRPFLAAASFVALTLVLAVDFNVTELYRETHKIPTCSRRRRAEPRAHPQVALLRLFAPLDRAVRPRGGGASTATESLRRASP